jgi:hypothetical protein
VRCRQSVSKRPVLCNQTVRHSVHTSPQLCLVLRRLRTATLLYIWLDCVNASPSQRTFLTVHHTPISLPLGVSAHCTSLSLRNTVCRSLSAGSSARVKHGRCRGVGLEGGAESACSCLFAARKLSIQQLTNFLKIGSVEIFVDDR